MRQATEADAALLARAARATMGEDVSAEEMQEQMQRNLLRFYLCESETGVTCLGVQFVGDTALLTAYYREGTPEGLLADSRQLMASVVYPLQNVGFHVAARLDLKNPRYARLISLYRRLGFAPRETWLTLEERNG